MKSGTSINGTFKVSNNKFIIFKYCNYIICDLSTDPHLSIKNCRDLTDLSECTKDDKPYEDQIKKSLEKFDRLIKTKSKK